eukprot:COSAG01_NODE_30541_length_614_cov_0.667961_1_plen_109_part_00
MGAQKIWDILTNDGRQLPRGLRHYTTLLSAYRGAIQRVSQPLRGRRAAVDQHDDHSPHSPRRSAVPMLLHNGDLVCAFVGRRRAQLASAVPALTDTHRLPSRFLSPNY